MDEQGRAAASPWAMPWPAWRQILSRTWQESSDDNIGLIAAGVAFYGFLAITPLLGATVLTYGIFAAPDTVVRHMQALAGLLPEAAAISIGQQLLELVQASDGRKGLGVVIALGIALFGARNGAGAILTALNIAYEEKETRGFIRLTLTALAFTAAMVVAAIVAAAMLALLGSLNEVLAGAPGFVNVLLRIVGYALLAAAGAAGAALLYRYGPSRHAAKWKWLTPGSILSAVLWLLLTLGFGLYVANIGRFDATYGSLGAVAAFLTWLYLASYVLLLGAELNAEIEHQTREDTTVGAPQPLGQRDAWVADHVAGGKDEGEAAPAHPAAPADRQGGAPRPTAAQVPARRSISGLASAALAGSALPMLTRSGRRMRGAVLLAAATLLWRRQRR